MALEGSLKEFGLADILQLIYYQRKTGELIVEGSFDRVRLLFYEGNIVFAESSKRGESRLGMILVKKGLVGKPDLEKALSEQRASGGKLGNVLIKMGALSKEELKNTLTGQFTELVSYLFTWRQGRYEFKPQGIALDKDVPISLDTQHILMDGLRILDEWSLVEGKITLESVFERTGNAPEGLSEEEKEVYLLVDGESDVSAIAGISGLDNFQVSKALLGLHEKGLIVKKKAPEEKKAKALAREKAHLPVLFLETVFAALFLLSLVFFLAGGIPEEKKIYRASEELDNLRFLIQVYNVENGKYPEKLESVGNSLDPWGNPYIYKTGENGFSLRSMGPDGRPDSGDIL
jgi:hypothetical protein